MPIIAGDDRYQKSGLYVDSPMSGSVKQFYPFFRSGFFDSKQTQILLRKRVGGPNFKFAPSLENLSFHKESTLSTLKLNEQVIFYCFNSKSNVSMMANRSVKHALILHGESNKISSCRPMARMYDFVCVSGSAARDRYLSNGIFTQDEVDRGRLIMTGDTFVQTMDAFCPAGECDTDPWILYAPTWENSSSIENYTSAENGYGFDVAIRAAEVLDCRKIAIKLHPNFGTKNDKLLGYLIKKIGVMIASGFEVRLIEPNLGFITSTLLRAKFGNSIFHTPESAMPVKMAVIDVSGMEAICLKQGIPHVVITKPGVSLAISKTIANEIYPWKTIEIHSATSLIDIVINNVQKRNNLDELHKQLVFGYSIPGFESQSDKDRNFMLVDHMIESEYWI